MELNKWGNRFLALAKHVAGWSKDQSTKCGCVIVKGKKVKGLGFNGYPEGVEDKYEPRHLKYEKTIHAEVNAILNAKEDLSGCTLFVYPLRPCARCASVIAQAGITHVIAGEPRNKDKARWLESFKITEDTFAEVGIKLEVYDYD